MLIVPGGLQMASSLKQAYSGDHWNIRHTGLEAGLAV